MRHPDSRAHLRATRTTHSLGTTLKVALLVTLLPALAVLAGALGGATVAFLAGAATSTGVAVLRRRFRRRRAADRSESRSVLATGN